VNYKNQNCFNGTEVTETELLLVCKKSQKSKKNGTGHGGLLDDSLRPQGQMGEK